jgi:hypothetical protein
MDEESRSDWNGYSHPRNDFLKRTSSYSKRRWTTAGNDLFHWLVEERIAPEKVVYAQNQGSPTFTF